MSKEVLIFLCNNCLPSGADLPAQWDRDDVHVEIHKLPCSGKVSVEYIFHAIEGGKDAVCIITCPPGACTLFQGNYRAHIRTETVRQLLGETGLSPDMIQLMHFSREDSRESLEKLIRDYIDKTAEQQPGNALKQTG